MMTSSNEKSKTKATDNKNKIIFIISAFIWIVVSVVCFVYRDDYGNYCNFFTALGTETSIIGLFLALLQITKMRDSAEKTEENVAAAKRETEETKQKADEIFSVVQENVKRVNQMIVCSDIRSFSFLPQDITNLIITKQYDRAFDKMETLRKCLIDIKGNPQYSKDVEKIDGYLTELGDNKDILRKLCSKLNNSANATNSSLRKLDPIYTFLNKISDFLETLAVEIKYSNLNEAYCGK